jgi:hypothetical protein
MEKPSADQCTKGDEVWCAKMAHSDQATAMEAGRSPSGVEKAYVAAVPSRKKLAERASVSGSRLRGKIRRGMERGLQGKEDEDLGPDTGVVGETVDTKSVKGGNNDEDGGPSVVEREGKVDEELVAPGLGDMMLLDDIVNMLGGCQEMERRSMDGRDSL